jgi:hypothetical protein
MQDSEIDAQHDLPKDPWDPLNLNVIEAVGDFQADAEFDYIPVGAALAKYSSLLEVLSYNKERLTAEQMADILADAHQRMIRKLHRVELHMELTGTTPRLPR